EAMAAGIPVLTSNRSSLPEAAGDAALLVNPEDTDAIREALVRLAQSPELRARLVECGYARMKLFSWDKASAETWQAYQELR
ncbi:MAG: glycosyltransferase, partial [Acidobacteriia bacterium]|nr:glycosyltransferase [Terriglobia bacterium]